LLAYAAAASAAGVGLLASSPAADAEVVYTPAHQVITSHHGFLLDIDNNGMANFGMNIYFLSAPHPPNPLTCGGTSCFRFSGSFITKPVGGNQVVGVTSYFRERYYASALPANTEVGPNSPLIPQAKSAELETCCLSNDTYNGRGYWGNPKNPYLGLKFIYKGEVHYGWARLKTAIGPQPCQLKALLTGYAYESEPNTAIITGQIAPGYEQPDSAEPVLEPASLGWLARGAEGLQAWRRQPAMTH
jgi:hypothetical protein